MEPVKKSCEIFYKNDTDLDKVIVDKTENFLLSDVWLNKQPAKCLKEFDFTLVNKNTILNCKSTSDKVFIKFDPKDQTVLLNVTCGIYKKELTVLPQLTGYGLRLMVQEKFDWKNFEIIGEDGCSIDESSPFGYDSLSLTIERKDVVIEEAKPPKEEGIHTMGIRPFDFVNFRDMVTVTITSDAPAWRTIDKGFNLEGKCRNTLCPSFNKGFVCIEKKFDAEYQKGMVCSNKKETFHISEVTTLCICPGCKMELLSEDIDNCIIYDCKATITGRTATNVPFPPLTIISKKLEPQSFLRDLVNQPNGNVISWKYLKITVEDISPKPGCTLF